MSRDDKTTSEDLRPGDIFSWPLTLAMLERAHVDGPYALRYGLLCLAAQCLRDMTAPEASPEIVARLQGYVDVLAHLVRQPKEDEQ